MPKLSAVPQGPEVCVLGFSPPGELDQSLLRGCDVREGNAQRSEGGQHEVPAQLCLILWEGPRGHRSGERAGLAAT